MATKELTDEDLMRFMRFALSETAASTYTTASFDTQLSIERGVVWEIRRIEFDIQEAITANPLTIPAASDVESVGVQIMRETKTALVGFNDSDLIQGYQWKITRSAAIGTDAGPLWVITESPIVYTYDPPILYAGQNIHVAIQSTMAAVRTVRGRIGYTIRKVSDRFFFRVAQALVA